MSKVLIEEQTLHDIGAAIREKTSSSTRFKPSDMANAISSIISLGIQEPQLPDDYQKVEYLTCNGAEWIDINIPLPADTQVSFKCKTTSTTPQTVLGGRHNATSTKWDFGFEDGDYYAANGCKVDSENDWSNSDNLWHVIGTVTNSFNTTFRYGNYYYSVQYPFYGQLYKLIIVHYVDEIVNGLTNFRFTELASFIPCYRKSDGVIGFYDVVNDVFYTNAGTGAFQKGPDI